MSTVNEKMTAIADPIRSLMKETEPLTLDDMASSAEQMVEANADLEKVLYGTDFGGKSQYDEFWDDYQLNGNRTNYDGAFYGDGWSDRNFNPKYPMKPTSVYRMFYNSHNVTDYSKFDIDFSNFTGNFDQVFYANGAKKVGVINLSSATQMMNCFQYSSIETIEKIILKEDGSQNILSNSFNYTLKLKNIAFEGKIGVSIQFPDSSLLSYESIMGEQGIVNALKDYSGATSTYTLTLHADAKARLTDAEKAIITQKGWTLA
jgi:hypothetical protein